MTDQNDLWDSAAEQGDELDKIRKHIERYIGKPSYIGIDTMPSTITLDLYTICANNHRPYHTIITLGMSGLPAEVPEDQSMWKYTELMIYLPESWPVTKEAIKDFADYWPVGWLKKLGRFPHENNTWFCWGDTIPNGEPATPFADNTEFCCMVLLPPIREAETFFELKINEEKSIRFLVVVPIYREEMDFQLKNGFKKLLDKFDAYNINDIIALDRPNTCK